MRLMYGHDEMVAAWVAARVSHVGAEGFGPCVALGVADTNLNPIGGVVFHDWAPHYASIQISIAATNPKWLTRNIVSEILRYPFAGLKVQRLTAITPPDKAASVWRFLTKLGFREEGRVRKGLGTEDAVVWGLLASEWRTNRFNVDRAVERKGRKRRRRSGTLTLQGTHIH